MRVFHLFFQPPRTLCESGLQRTPQAALLRVGSHSAGLDLELARCNFPFVKLGGLKFLEAAHLKDWLAWPLPDAAVLGGGAPLRMAVGIRGGACDGWT